MTDKSDLDVTILTTLKEHASGARTPAQRTAQAAFMDLTSKAGADTNTLSQNLHHGIIEEIVR